MGRRGAAPTGLLVLVTAAIAAVGLPAQAAAPPATTVNCPIAGKRAAATVGWAFSAAAPKFYIHGRGTYAPVRAAGTVCEQSSAGANAPTQLVLTVRGRGSLARGITRGGVLGAQLVLPVAVSASEAPSCRAHSRGKVTLFTSYNAAHRDMAKLHLGGGCASFSHSFAGAGVHVSIPH